jgi:hypothetical protein
MVAPAWHGQTAWSEDPQAILTAGEGFSAYAPEGCPDRMRYSANAAAPFSFSFPFGTRQSLSTFRDDHETALQVTRLKAAR